MALKRTAPSVVGDRFTKPLSSLFKHVADTESNTTTFLDHHKMISTGVGITAGVLGLRAAATVAGAVVGHVKGVGRIISGFEQLGKGMGGAAKDAGETTKVLGRLGGAASRAVPGLTSVAEALAPFAAIGAGLANLGWFFKVEHDAGAAGVHQRWGRNVPESRYSGTREQEPRVGDSRFPLPPPRPIGPTKSAADVHIHGPVSILIDGSGDPHASGQSVSRALGLGTGGNIRTNGLALRINTVPVG